jgi:hypothetical protein
MDLCVLRKKDLIFKKHLGCHAEAFLIVKEIPADTAQPKMQEKKKSVCLLA